MTFGSARGGAMDAWFAPGTALCFSVMVAFLAPNYPAWFGTLPPLTRRFLDAYPLWIGLSIVVIVLQVFARVVSPGTRFGELARRLESLFGIVSVLIIAVGIIALAMPVFVREMP